MSALRKAPAALAFLLAAACQDTSLPTTTAPTRAAANPNVYTGWIFTPAGEPIEVRYEVIGGRSIMEGDIDLGPAGSVPTEREELLARARRPSAPQGAAPQRGSVIDGNRDYTWQYGFVPYVISVGNFDQTQQQVILDAMAHIASTTAGTSFMARTNQSSYIRFSLNSSMCSSAVGRQGGEQTIALTSGCAFSIGSVAHEILHALGMWHEQSRCDRDTFVIINWQNIQSGKESNFDQKCPPCHFIWCSPGGVDKLSYAEASIMHYGPFDFSSNGQPTITSRRGLDNLMGQRSGLDQTDASTINLVYRPYPVQHVLVTYPGGTPTISWNAYGHGVTGYSVCMLRVYAEYNDYANTQTSWEELMYCVGSTTGLSLQDPYGTYTGYSSCELYRDPYMTQSYSYYYEIVAGFPDGVASEAWRVLAAITPRYPPCFGD